MATQCERCKREDYKFEQCNYCGRSVCIACEKASQRASKLNRLVICRSCWSDMGRRKAYKNRQDLMRGIVVK